MSLAHFALAKASAIEPAVTADEPAGLGARLQPRSTQARRRGPEDACLSMGSRPRQWRSSSISDDIALQKIRNNGKLQPMSNPARPHAESKVHPAWRLLTSRDQAPRKKIFR
jgi:hypothetical protein